MSGKSLYPDAVPFIPFPLPVPRPVDDPDTSPQVSVCFRDEWLPYVLGCLKAMVDPAAWQATTQAELDEAIKRSMLLMGMFSEAGPCVSPPGAGCFIADFTLLDYGFVADVSAPCLSTWSSTGWDSCSPGITSPDEIKVDRLFSPAATFITSFSATWNVDAPAISSVITVTFLLNGSVVGTFTQTNVGPGSQTYSAAANVQADEIIIDIVRSGGTFGTMQLKSLELCYVGAFPLSTALPTWSHDIDFTLSDGGFSVIVGGDGRDKSIYVSGVGWEALSQFPPDEETDLRIARTLSSSGQFTRVRAVYRTTQALDFHIGLNFAVNLPLDGTGSSITVDSGPINVTTSNLRHDLVTMPHIAGSDLVLTSLHYEGVGVNPF